MTLRAAALIAASTLALQAHAESFTFQSSDPAGNPNFQLQQQWTDMVRERSDGELDITLLPVGSTVEYNETQEAVGAGILDGHVTDTSYFAGRDPAFALIANPVGAWSDPEEMFGFIEEGGGRELMNELMNPYGLQFIGATTTGLEAFTSKVPIEGVDDLDGLKMRAPEGLVQQVFAAAGAAPVNLPSSEVFTSLDKGVIDAADYTVFSTNAAQGLHDVAEYSVYPGFHSMPLIEISMNKDRYDALSDEHKQLLEDTVSEFARMQVTSLAEADQAAVEEARAEGTVTVIDWPDEERARFREIAAGEWTSIAEGSENAQKVYDALTGYLEAEGLMNTTGG